MVIERCRNLQSTAAVTPLSLSSPFGFSPWAGGSRGACAGRGFYSETARAGGNNTAARRRWPGTPSPGTTLAVLANLPR